MDSNPPLQVEDHTDADFFDKLVDDDDDGVEVVNKVHSSSSFAEWNDSDDKKALASLSIGDVQDSGWEGDGGTEAIGETASENINAVSSDGHFEDRNSLVSSNSFGFDSVVESTAGGIGTEVTSDSTISNQSEGSGIKEVQWAAFNSDSGQSNRFGSYSDFFSDLGDGALEPPGKVEDSFGVVAKTGSGSEDVKENYSDRYNSTQYQEGGAYNSATVHNVDGQDQSNTQYWENLYPGWKYDMNTGKWYEVDSYGTTGNVQENFGSNSAGHSAGAGGNSHDSYMQQTSQASAGTVPEKGTANSVHNWNRVSQGNVGSESASNWNQAPQVNNEYPAHMVFDPQYPGWYYDTIAQEWRSLETYTSSLQSSNQTYNQQNQNGYTSGVTSSHENQQTYIGSGQVNNSRSQGFTAPKQDQNWGGSFNNYNQNNLNMWQPDSTAKNGTSMNFSVNQQSENDYGSKYSVTNHASQQASYDSRAAVPYYREVTEDHNIITTGSSNFVSTGNFSQHVNQPSMQKNDQRHLSNGYYGNQNSGNFSQQQLQSGNQFSYAPEAGRSSAGRPPHALVTFGFGGKLIVAKYGSSFNTQSFETLGPVGSSISVLNLVEVFSGNIDTPNMGSSTFVYFNTLCKQSYPGPLVGGSVGTKELNKWIDERIASCGSSDADYRKDEVLKLLLSLLKIACQYYGKLRSPFGSDTTLRESDYPESAVARLFSSAKENSARFSNFGGIAHCLQNSPSEAHMLATASEVQSLLVSGKKKEALHCATEGQLWGPALVLATQLGEQFYVDTVKQMALRQLVAGSPLRTLCLLIAGQPADVFSITPSESSIPHTVNMSLQSTQCATNYMLDSWEENLAVITANRTKDDHLVLIHLGDCLWKEKSEIFAAHICYLVAEANFEQYSDSARLCLIGADHWKFPRTYASPDAIQRTELFEYAKVLGNPQFILLPFQPYKVIYAHMLAEVGKVTESLKYCQAVLKSLKAGRAPEADTCRQLISSLDERIRTYQQGGFSSNSTNLVSKKLVGKLFNFIDSTAHRVVGGLPPPVPSTSHGSSPANEHSYQTMGLRVSASQSTMAMSSLMPSASVEPINEWTAEGTRKPRHNRSVSEPDFFRTPDFGRPPIQDHHVESSKQASSPGAQDKSSGGASRFGRFGFGSQLFQKTVGLVLKRQDRQAKLGETNKFYYDEKLKRWVEEGAEAAADEPPLPPPPKVSTLQNGGSDYNLKGGSRNEGSPKIGSPEFRSPTPSDHASGIPPIPPASNQFSARGRGGVRSRYVDTFNKGGGNASSGTFMSPSIATNSAPMSGANPKFFVPSPVPSPKETSSDTVVDNNVLESTSTNEDSSVRTSTSSFHSPPAPASVSIQRFPSMDNLGHKSATATGGSGTLPPHSRRTASWSGSFADGYSHHFQGGTGVKPLGEVLGFTQSSFMPSVPSSGHLPMNGGTIGEDLHEVEL